MIRFRNYHITCSPTNVMQASWVTSLSQLGLPFGALATGLLADTIGRRKSALYVHSMTHMIGFGLIVVANNVWFVYAGRFMTGVCMGMCNSLCFIYVTELCLTHKQVRHDQGPHAEICTGQQDFPQLIKNKLLAKYSQ